MLVGVVCCSGTGCWMLWSRFEAVLVTAVEATMGGGSWVGGGGAAAAGVTPTGCVGITMGGAGGLAAAVAAGRAVGVAAATSGEAELETAAE